MGKIFLVLYSFVISNLLLAKNCTLHYDHKIDRYSVFLNLSNGWGPVSVETQVELAHALAVIRELRFLKKCDQIDVAGDPSAEAPLDVSCLRKDFILTRGEYFEVEVKFPYVRTSFRQPSKIFDLWSFNNDLEAANNLIFKLVQQKICSSIDFMRFGIER